MAAGRAPSWSRTSTQHRHPGMLRGSDPSSLTAVGGRLFFSADDGTHGEELWKSDGSRAGTVLVKNINPDRRDTASTAAIPPP